MINHSFQSSLSSSYESSSVSCLFQHIFNKLLLHCRCFQFLAVYLHIFSTYVFPLVSSSLVSLSFFPPILIRLPTSATSLRPLRSMERRELFVPRARTTIAMSRSFAVIAPSLWNRLPPSARASL